jgi:hypothetical protein
MATTPNYGWTKPIVGGDNDVWGAEINTDLDSIDTVVHGIDTRVIPAASSTAPAMDGAASAGTAAAFARGDHVHPTDTTRAAAGALPLASTTPPAMDGAQTIGSNTTHFALADHVHPTDTTRAAASALPLISTATPNMNSGAGSAGVGPNYAAGDHVHPTDTSRAAASALASYLPLAGGALTGALTPSQTAGIIGTTTNNNVAAGGVGEYQSAAQTVGVALTNGVAKTIVTLPLTAGDWNVDGVFSVLPSVTVTDVQGGISITTNTLPGTFDFGAFEIGTTSGSLNNVTFPTGTMRVQLAAPGNVFLVGYAEFAGSCTGYGKIQARRVR